MATIQNLRLRQPLNQAWYELVAALIQALIPKYGLAEVSAEVYRAYALICETSLNGGSAGSTARSSTLNHDGTPIQFALTLGLGAVPLQFLSEVGDPGLSSSESNELVEDTIRKLSASLRFHGDLDFVLDVIHRASTVNALDPDPDQGGTFWLGAGFAAGGPSTVKIYINGKNGTEKARWLKFENFARDFGASETHSAVRRFVAGKMLPLGMAVTLSQGRSPAGRIYLHGYGNPVAYYEDLIRQLGGGKYPDRFRQFSEVMLAEDYAFPTQSVVFSAGFAAGSGWPVDIKIEFCCHCLFQGDAQARDCCLQWLTLRNIDAGAYRDTLDAIAGEMKSDKISAHVYLGLGWKKGLEYTTVYLKPHPVGADIANA